MDGEESRSFFVLCDGTDALPHRTAQASQARRRRRYRAEHRHGALFRPPPVLTDAVAERAMAEIIRPTLRVMVRARHAYRRVLLRVY